MAEERAATAHEGDARPRPRRGPLAEPAMALAVWVVALIALGGLIGVLPSRATQLDFSHYYASAWAMRAGMDPYRTDLRPLANSLGLDVSDNVIGTYPPSFILAFETLTLLSPARAYWTWIAINAVAMGVALVLLLGRGSGLDAVSALSLAGAAIVYPAFSENFFYSQSHALELLSLVLMMRWMGRGMDRAAGLALAFAGLLRIFPLAMVGYLIVRRRWRVLSYTILGLAFGAGVTVIYLGPKVILGFAAVIPFVTSPYWLMRPPNVALDATIGRVMVYLMLATSIAISAPAAQAIEVTCELGLLAITVWATAMPAGEPDQDWRAFSLWIVATVLLAPTAWLHYMVLLFIPMTQIAAAHAAHRVSTRATLIAAFSFAVLTVFLLILQTKLDYLRMIPIVLVKEAAPISLIMVYISMWFFVRDPVAAS